MCCVRVRVRVRVRSICLLIRNRPRTHPNIIVHEQDKVDEVRGDADDTRVFQDCCQNIAEVDGTDGGGGGEEMK